VWSMPKSRRCLGISGRLLGQEVEILVPERFWTYTLSTGRSSSPSPGCGQWREGLQLYGRRKDGTEFPVEIQSQSAGDGKRARSSPLPVRDVTERARSEEALRQTQADLAHISRVTTMES